MRPSAKPCPPLLRLQDCPTNTSIFTVIRRPETQFLGLPPKGAVAGPRPPRLPPPRLLPPRERCPSAQQRQGPQGCPPFNQIAVCLPLSLSSSLLLRQVLTIFFFLKFFPPFVAFNLDNLERFLPKAKKARVRQNDADDDGANSVFVMPTLPKDREVTFTLAQVRDIVKKAVEDREESLRDEYNQVLKEKLSEQFDNFSKFNQDYISRQLKESQWDCKPALLPSSILMSNLSDHLLSFQFPRHVVRGFWRGNPTFCHAFSSPSCVSLFPLILLLVFHLYILKKKMNDQ